MYENKKTPIKGNKSNPLDKSIRSGLKYSKYITQNSFQLSSSIPMKKKLNQSSTLPVQRKINYKLNIRDIKSYSEDKFEELQKEKYENLKSENERQSSGRWTGKNPNLKHTIASMITFGGEIINGYSRTGKSDLIPKEKRKEYDNPDNICAEEDVLTKSENSGKKFIFSIARDFYGAKPACSKCASGYVLGKHNIVDIKKSNWYEQFKSKHDVDNLFKQRLDKEKEEKKRLDELNKLDDGGGKWSTVKKKHKW